MKSRQDDFYVALNIIVKESTRDRLNEYIESRSKNNLKVTQGFVTDIALNYLFDADDTGAVDFDKLAVSNILGGDVLW